MIQGFRGSSKYLPSSMKINREGIYNAVISAKRREEKDSVTSVLSVAEFSCVSGRGQRHHECLSPFSLRLEAKTQLDQYSLDEKFQKSIGQTTLKKLVLIFSGNRMVHHSEI